MAIVDCSPVDDSSIAPRGETGKGRFQVCDEFGEGGADVASKVQKRAGKVDNSSWRRLSFGIATDVHVKNHTSQLSTRDSQTGLPVATLQSQPQHRVDSLSLIHEDYTKLELPPRICPLTAENLQLHTQQTNPGEAPLPIMTETNSLATSREVLKDKEKLEQFGWIKLPDQGAFPGDLESFIRNIVKNIDEKNTPGAKKLHQLHPRAIDTNEAKAAEIISQWLLPREEDHGLGGEAFIAVAIDSRLAEQYVKYPGDESLDLKCPKPDRIIGFASYHSELRSIFDEAQWTVIQRYTVGFLHNEAHFAIITAEFKSAKGKGIYYAALQQACSGIAANNYMRDFFRSAGITPTTLDTVHFGITCDATRVVLYLHWIDMDGRHYMKRIFETLMAADDHLGSWNEGMVKMRNYIRNIVAWARDVRIVKIKAAIAARKSQIDAQRRREAAQSQDEQGTDSTL
ncbi:hypothetical protein SVAN01_09403 [Stagonosporopsis vannaccii]|nr:hypothetical protein SVAN01_09403 [Stagonosporopsis vannaccii]